MLPAGQLLLVDMLPSPMGLLAKSGFVLLLAGLAFKLSLVPLHFWTPDVYQGAPVNSTLLLTTLSKAAVFALFIKLILLVPADFEADMLRMLSWMAIASMLLGNWLALQQQSIKRLMAVLSHRTYGICVSGGHYCHGDRPQFSIRRRQLLLVGLFSGFYLDFCGIKFVIQIRRPT